MFPSYMKVAKVEGNFRGATIAWGWEWAGAPPAPNVFPLGERCVVTNEPIGPHPFVVPTSGVLTLRPTVTCGEDVTALDPITLTLGVTHEEKSVCCLGLIDPEDCPPCEDEEDGDTDKTVNVFVRVGGSGPGGLWSPNDGNPMSNVDGSQWNNLGNSGTLPTHRPLYLAYGVEQDGSGGWLSADRIYDYAIPGTSETDGVYTSPPTISARTYPIPIPGSTSYFFSTLSTLLIPPAPPATPVGLIYWSGGPLQIIPTDPTVQGASFS